MLTVRQVRNLSDPLRTFNFDIKIPTIPGTGSAEELTLRCMSSQLPGWEYDAITITAGGPHPIKLPGKIKYTHSWNVTVLEGRDRAIHRALRSWGAMQFDPIDGTALTSQEYKVSGLVTLYDNAGDKVSTNRLEGLWVMKVDDVELSYEKSEAINFKVTFSYDNWVELD